MAQCKLCGEYKPSDSFNWCEKCQDKVVREAVRDAKGSDPMTDRDKAIEAAQAIVDWYEMPVSNISQLGGMIERLKSALALAQLDAAQPPTSFETTETRCACCGWPYSKSDSGCRPGNCSMRPLPDRMWDAERYKLEQSPPASDVCECGHVHPNCDLDPCTAWNHREDGSFEKCPCLRFRPRVEKPQCDTTGEKSEPLPPFTFGGK